MIATTLYAGSVTRRPSKELQLDLTLAGALALFTFLVIVATANDIGITYDEPVYAGEAMRAQEWLGEVFRLTSRGEVLAFTKPELIERYWRGKDMQPALLKWAIALLGPISSAWLPGLAGFRAATALFAALMVAATFAAARVTMSRGSAIGAAFLLLGLPHVFSLAHLMSLDVPVAAMTTLTTLLCYQAVTRQRLGWWMAAGLSFGLAVSAKMNGVLVLPAMATWIVIRRERTRENLLKLGGVAALGFVTFVATWPFLWIDPLDRLGQFMRFHFQHYPVHVYYLGKVHLLAPWHYPLVMIAATTPILPLAMMLGGSSWTLTDCVRRRASSPELLWLLSAGIQIAAFVNPSTPKYNGVRLFVAAFPFLCLLAGRAFEWALSLPLTARLKAQPRVLVPLWLLALTPSLTATVGSHPFGMSFYNGLVGGTRYAPFEPTFWGDAYFHTLPYLNEHVPKNGAVCVLPDSVVWLFDYYRNLGMLRQDIRAVANWEEGDYVVFHTRQSEMPPLAHTLYGTARRAFNVRHEGRALAVVVRQSEVKWAVERDRLRGVKKNSARP